MIQLLPQLKILLACQPVDFRRGIDGLAALCRKDLAEDPISGKLYVFRNRSGTSIKMICYDGVGYWMFTRRFSRGRLRWWPQAHSPVYCLQAQELSVLLYNGLPDKAAFVEAWRKVDPTTFPQAAFASSASSSQQ